MTLLFWRDSLFEHLFFTQEGRPESDGLYALTLGVDGAEVSTGILTRVQDYVMNFDPAGRPRVGGPGWGWSSLGPRLRRWSASALSVMLEACLTTPALA